MRILFFSTMAGTPWGGSEVLWSKMANHLLENGHEVIASVFNWGYLPPDLASLEEKGLIIHKRSRVNFDSVKGKIRGRLTLSTISKYQLYNLKKVKPDIVFFSLGGAFDLTIPIYSNYIKSLSIPYCCYLSLNTEYEVIPINKIRVQRALFSNADKVFFVSERNKDTLQRQICSEMNNSMVINNPITFEDLSKVEIYQRENINFAMVARLDAFVKGHPIVLRILSNEIWKRRNWILNIYGHGPDEEYIKELIRFYKLEDKVNIIGQVKDIKNEIWAKNHVLLMPSQYEGCPISLYDAAICGRCAVVTDVGGNAEFVVENANGFVAAAPSVNSFGGAMENMWANKHRLNELGNKAREKALSFLDLTPHLSVIKVLENITNKL